MPNHPLEPVDHQWQATTPLRPAIDMPETAASRRPTLLPDQAIQGGRRS